VAFHSTVSDRSSALTEYLKASSGARNSSSPIAKAGMEKRAAAAKTGARRFLTRTLNTSDPERPPSYSTYGLTSRRHDPMPAKHLASI
jgi:hypothetical protein